MWWFDTEWSLTQTQLCCSEYFDNCPNGNNVAIKFDLNYCIPLRIQWGILNLFFTDWTKELADSWNTNVKLMLTGAASLGLIAVSEGATYFLRLLHKCSKTPSPHIMILISDSFPKQLEVREEGHGCTSLMSPYSSGDISALVLIFVGPANLGGGFEWQKGMGLSDMFWDNQTVLHPIFTVAMWVGSTDGWRKHMLPKMISDCHACSSNYIGCLGVTGYLFHSLFIQSCFNTATRIGKQMVPHSDSSRSFFIISKHCYLSWFCLTTVMKRKM